MARYRLLFPVLIGGLLAGPGCVQQRPTGAAAVRTSVLRTLPEASVGMLVIDVGTLRDRRSVAGWLADLSQRGDLDGALQALLERFGAPLLTHLDRVALTIMPLEADRLGYGVLAEGDFDEPELVRLLGGVRQLTLLEVADRPDLSVSILPGGTLAVGPRAILGIVERNQAAPEGGLVRNRQLMSLLEKVESTSQIWGAFDYAPMAELARRAAAAEGTGLKLPATVSSGALLALAFQSHLDDPIRFNLIGQAALEDDARRLADAVRGLVALARMAAGADGAAPWLKLLETLTIGQSGAYVTVEGEVPEETLAGLSGLLERPVEAPPPATAATPEEPPRLDPIPPPPVPPSPEGPLPIDPAGSAPPGG